MNEPTLYLYAHITADPKNITRFMQRWEEAGVAGARNLLVHHVQQGPDTSTAIGETQHRLIQYALSQVSYLQLGYAVAQYAKEAAASHALSD
jgi:hypothetical protein